MNTVERLLAATSDMWKVYNEHPFVLGIQNGTLDKDKFRFYTDSQLKTLIRRIEVFDMRIRIKRHLQRHSS